MARPRKGSPTIVVKIASEAWERAKRSKSGACLIADSIKAQYPELTGATADMATCRVSDRKVGKRYTYLTPPIAQHLLLAFDQGWRQPTEEIVLKRAVKIDPILEARPRAGARSSRKAELAAKVADGTATRIERASLARMQNRDSMAPRPHTAGPTIVTGDNDHPIVVHNGRPIPQGKAHPNLLRGTDRHFGARMADPGIAFREAVDAALAQHLAEADAASPE